MHTLLTVAIVFICIFAGALFGMALRAWLPQDHLSNESKSVVQTATGLIATMAALILGLLIYSAKGSYNAQIVNVDTMAADIGLLDSVLQEYGPPAEEVRQSLRTVVVEGLARVWPADGLSAADVGALPMSSDAKRLHAEILALTPTDDRQRALHSLAMQTAAELVRLRLLLGAQQDSMTISGLFLCILSLWLVALFASFGLFAPRNGTVMAAILVSGLSVVAALFLVLELEQPFSGLMQIPSTPIRDALAHLGS